MPTVHLYSCLKLLKNVIFEIFTAVTIKNAIFRDVLPIQIVVRCSVLQLLVTANVPSLLILSIPMMEAIRSSETSVLTRATWSHIPESGHSSG
jgi:hypothetical protein